MCPRCGSSSLTYKNVFDYYKCNQCETTFITPVYSYGDAKWGYESARNLSRQLFERARPEAAERQEAVPEAYPRKRRRSGSPWLVAIIIICLLVLVSVVVWSIFGDYIKDFVGGFINF